MRICSEHWKEMKEALIKRGLSNFISKDSETAKQHIVAELKGDFKTPDPLLQMNFMFFGRALEYGGIYLMGTKDGVPYCPLCELNEHAPPATGIWEGKKNSEYWIETAADFLSEEFKKEGLNNLN